MNSLAHQAVAAALTGRWQEARRLNRKILSEDSQDLDALNRLGRAYLELGKAREALASYKKVIRLDPYNSIAQKAVGRLSKVRSKTKIRNHWTAAAAAAVFLEEGGKTKTVPLIHLGAMQVLTSLDVADQVKLAPHAHRVSVETFDNHYVGRLPDDISRRIIKLCRAGNEYEAYVRSVAPDNVRVFIRETKRGQAIADIPSFPQTGKSSYIAFTPPDLVHDERPDMGDGEETGDGTS